MRIKQLIDKLTILKDKYGEEHEVNTEWDETGEIVGFKIIYDVNYSVSRNTIIIQTSPGDVENI